MDQTLVEQQKGAAQIFMRSALLFFISSTYFLNGTLMSAHPTFPAGEPASIMGLGRFHFSVRNGKRWDTPE